MKFILGRKIGMSQLFNKEGDVEPVTWIEAGPCFVVRIKTKEKDGYNAIQVGFLEKKTEKVKKTEKKDKYKYLREVRSADIDQQTLKEGEKIDTSIFSEGDIVKISGTSKAKGFQGVVKRWGFAGAPKTHGTKHALRQPGSIGQQGLERVLKGKKMAGRTGGKRVTVKNLRIVKVDKEKNLIAVEGALPGRKGTNLEIRTQ
jgi:large subunit ribosomal protein L3